MGVFEFTGVIVTINILLHHAATTYAGPDDRTGGYKGLIVVAMQLFYQLPHGRRFDIKAADGIAGSETLFDQRVFFEFFNIMDIDIDAAVRPDQVKAFPDMSQAALA